MLKMDNFVDYYATNFATRYIPENQSNMTMEKKINLKMYLLFKMVIFQLAMSVCWRVYVQISKFH